MEQTPSKMVVNTIPPEDQMTRTKTVYEVSAFEIFWRNFLAGMSRALGAIFVYTVLIYILYAVFTAYLWPYIGPLARTLQDTLSTLNQISPKTPQNPLNLVDPNQLQQLLQTNR